MSIKNFSETITTRYNKDHEKAYSEVMDIVKGQSISKSTAQLLLVERGLVHTNNPEPLVKKEVVYKDRLVYKDPPKEEHITEHLTAYEPTPKVTHIGIHKDTQKDTQEDTLKKDSNAGKWIIGLGGTGVILYCLYKLFTV